jgi:hypothetical protein
VSEPTVGAGRAARGRWLPDGFEHPRRVEVAFGHHLRPIGPDDADLDVVAVTGSRERLWRTYGATSGWPPADLTTGEDRTDLARRAAAAEAGAAYCYALLDTDETALLGHVVIGPAQTADADAEVSWWVVDECAGTDLARALDELVPRWIAADWPFARPRLDVSRLPSAFSAHPQGRDASSKT